MFAYLLKYISPSLYACFVVVALIQLFMWHQTIMTLERPIINLITIWSSDRNYLLNVSALLSTEITLYLKPTIIIAHI